MLRAEQGKFLLCFRCVSTSKMCAEDEGKILDFPDMGPGIPEQKERPGESLDNKRARLFYQSRYDKGLVLRLKFFETFAGKSNANLQNQKSWFYFIVFSSF